jgi:hypothetical protein
MIPGLAQADNDGIAITVATVEHGPQIGEIILNRHDGFAVQRLAANQFTFVNIKQAPNPSDLSAIENDLGKKIGNAFAQSLEQLRISFF